MWPVIAFGQPLRHPPTHSRDSDPERSEGEGEESPHFAVAFLFVIPQESASVPVAALLFVIPEGNLRLFSPLPSPPGKPGLQPWHPSPPQNRASAPGVCSLLRTICARAKEGNILAYQIAVREAFAGPSRRTSYTRIVPRGTIILVRVSFASHLEESCSFEEPPLVVKSN